MQRFISIISTLALLGAVLMVAGSAQAQIKITGHVVSGVGSFNDEPAGGGASTSSFVSDAEAALNFSAEGGNLKADISLMIRDSGGGVTPARYQIAWKLAESFTLEFWGSGFGLPAAKAGYEVYTAGHFEHDFSIGDLNATDTNFFEDIGGLNATYGTSTMSFGGSLVTACLPACPGAGLGEEQTIVIHFLGKFGAFTLGAYNASASAVVTATGVGVDATALDVNGVYALESFKIGFEVSLYSDSTDAEGQNIAAGGDFGPIGFHYVTLEREDAAGTKTADQAELTLAYTMSVGDKGSFAVGYAQWSDDVAGAEQNDTLLIASVKLTF